jgi:hypothetical protein
MRTLHWRLPYIAFLLSGVVLVQQSAVAANCVLIPLGEQLQVAELRTDESNIAEPQYAEAGYRKRLLRFVNSYYSNIAEDILRGQGEYLASLHRLMGSASNGCTMAYKELLLQEVNSQDFGIALWTLRAAPDNATTTAQVWAVPDCKDCNVTEGKAN